MDELREMTDRLQESNVALQAATDEARAARDAAERAAEAAREGYRDLDQFAYMASHDLRAPLRGIANLAAWLQEDLGPVLTADSADHLRLLQSRVHRMGALIDGILAYSRAGRRLGEPEPVDAGALVREVLDLLAPPPEVTIPVAPDLPTLVAERAPLQQIFMNLIGNALKHARAARPDVEIRGRLARRRRQRRVFRPRQRTGHRPGVPRAGLGHVPDAGVARQGRGHRHRPGRGQKDRRVARRARLPRVRARQGGDLPLHVAQD
jgi:signal transduction histidine kinase